MKIHVKHLRQDTYKTTLHILTTTIDDVIIGPTFTQVSADLQPWRLFYWVYLRLWKFLPLKWKAKLTLHFGESEKNV